MKSRPAFFLLLAALLGAAGPAARGQQDGQGALGGLDWLNHFRAAHGLGLLEPEPALERAAAAYAAVLAASGRLSHRDAAGRSCLARYRAAGGSAARAGELLGAGPDLADVAAAWEASPAHAAAALDPRWTHAGAGRAQASAGELWVLLFAEQRLEGFRVVRELHGGYLVTGAFLEPAAAEAVLLSGLAAVPPEAWDPARREFRFHLPAGAGRLYHRLGYRSAMGGFSLAGAFFPEPAARAAR
jgi:hypothetical protein